jgi:hypothetical protein
VSLKRFKLPQPLILAAENNQLGESVKLGSAATSRFPKLLPFASPRKNSCWESLVLLGFSRLFCAFTNPSCQQC